MPFRSEPRFGVTRAITAFVLLVGIYSLIGCAKQKQEPVKRPPVPVSVGSVVEKTVPVQLRAIGNVEAYSTIQVRSQIGGILHRVHFKEGQDVKKGDLLFTIDPRPYEAMIQQAEANLAKDISQMEYAREEAGRYEELVKKGYVAKEQYEQFRTSAIALQATVNADKAVLENARLQLKYCYIYSPINGRTGNLISNEGNLIKANADNAMVVINQVQPIYVNFSVPEQNLSDIKKYMGVGKLMVSAFISKKDDSRNDEVPEEGVLTFVDNTVDPTTGTIKLKGTFENPKKRLWPGQFVDIMVTLTTQPNAVVVPSSAVQTGQNGQYVFVVKPDLTVESRPVTVSRPYGEFVIVAQGVTPGEKVVTDGQLQLFPGAHVEVKGEQVQSGAEKLGASAASQAPSNK